MASALDMSLDDLIKNNKQVGGRRSGAGRGGKAVTRRVSNNNAAAGGSYSGGKSGGAIRRQANRSIARANPYATSKASKRHTLHSMRRAPDTTWQHDLFEDGPGLAIAPDSRIAGIETGTKLYISNLDYGVSNDDIKELFSEVGDLKRCSIHYDRSGRSKGTAEVVFSRKSDGIAALKRYNNVQLDGKPMHIALVGTNLQSAGSGTFRVNNGTVATGRGRTVMMASRGRGRRGGASTYRGRGRGRGNVGRGSKPAGTEKTAEDLDAELEIYHSEAMQTS